MTTDYVEPETGEFYEAETTEDLDLQTLIYRRHHAAQEAAGWRQQVAMYDRDLLARMEGQRRVVTPDDLVCLVSAGYHVETDAFSFAATLGGEEAAREVLLGVIASAKGFRADLVPTEAVDAYVAATQRKDHKPSVTTRIVLHPAQRSLEKVS